MNYFTYLQESFTLPNFNQNVEQWIYPMVDKCESENQSSSFWVAVYLKLLSKFLNIMKISHYGKKISDLKEQNQHTAKLHPECISI